MSIKTLPINEVRQKLRDALITLEKTGEPYLITQQNRPKAVLVRYEDYMALVERAGEGHSHITRRPDVSGGEPIVRGTRVSVRYLIERIQASQSIEEILAALPRLTPAQIYDALSYYHDHQVEIDRLIEEGRPEKVMATQGLQVEKIAEGVAIAHDQAGRW